ncbi:phytanoyl-CoA dioxygenase family protein [Massilia sp. 9I]|uniref:phytanoyl-CoA dioxygenase family protein n=1 Tax=Massilia sp. 9I TaxID=2653152 RepID=UPI0012F172FF|nr:phytanoyl-CoA dioxygenase family protein [Massilia sp. 9I]VXC66111.1 Phytanoyl-CoA dioxygenase family protein [Massilia sp. 9I]
MRNPLPGVPHVESPFFSRLFSGPETDPETRRIALELAVRGFAIIDFPEPGFDNMAERVKRDLHGHYDFAGWRAHGHAAGSSLRVQDAWSFNEDVRRIACNERVIALLSRLYGRQAWPFQTLNFPVGTQQHFHTDSLHFSSSPERFMCGVWVALEDIDASNGPLMYFPGSHRWPIYTNEHIGACVAELGGTPTQAIYEAMWRELVEAHGVQPEYFHAKKGQALIWAANLMHGGTVQRDPARTRWSQVTHYFFEDCAYYTPMMSDPFYGSIAFRTLTSIASGGPVPNRVAGDDVPEKFIEATTPGQTRWREEDAFDPALYLLANPDVAAAGADPAAHYLLHGRREKRRLRP